MNDTRDKLPSRPSSIGQAHRIIVQLKARVEELDAMLMLDPTYADLTAKVAALEAQVAEYDKALEKLETGDCAIEIPDGFKTWTGMYQYFAKSERTRIADMGEKNE